MIMMHQIIYARHDKLARNLIIVVLLLIGFELHIADVGAAPLQGDEAWLTYLAYNFGHNGQRAALGVTSSAGVNQPPFFSDVFAIPFSFSPDPRMARIFMAGLQLVGASVLYFMVRRYWTADTALGALILYTVLPRAVWAGRFLWNPYLAIPFIIGFLATGFLLAEGKRWARWLHFPLLACAIGAHPIMATIGFLSPGFLARDWFTTRLRRKLLTDYVIGIILALLVLSPWMIGLIQQRVESPDQGTFYQRQRTSFATILQFTIAAPVSIDLGAIVGPQEDYVDPPAILAAGYQVIGWFSLLGSLFLVTRALLQIWKQNGRGLQRQYPDLMMGLAYLTQPVVLLFSPTRTYDQYFMALVPTAAVVQAIILVGDRFRDSVTPRFQFKLPRIVQRRTVAVGVATLMGVAELALVLNAMQQIHNLHQFAPGEMPSLADMIKVRDSAVQPNKETIYLVDSGSAVAFEQELVWLTLANKGQSRVIWGNSFAYPVPANGATYVGYVGSQNIPELYTLLTPRLIADNMYRIVDVPPNNGFSPTCQPDGPTRLGNGATFLGYYVPQTGGGSRILQVNQPWTIYVLWKSITNHDHTEYQIFNHLVDAQGTKFAQVDQTTLETDLWHDGDLMINKITLTPTDQLPPGKPLYLQVGMYRFLHGASGAIANVNAVDDKGNPVTGWITIPICSPIGRNF